MAKSVFDDEDKEEDEEETLVERLLREQEEDDAQGTMIPVAVPGDVIPSPQQQMMQGGGGGSGLGQFIGTVAPIALKAFGLEEGGQIKKKTQLQQNVLLT